MDYTLFLKAPQSPRASLELSSKEAIFNPSKPIRNISDIALNWERTERLVGGFWDASFTVTGEKSELQQYFTQWLNYAIEERTGLTRWHGNIWSMALSLNGVTRRVTLDEVYNAVRAKFTEHLWNGGFELGSGTTFTGWTNTAGTGSIAQETTVANVARGARAVKLTGNAMVSQSVTVRPQRAYRLSIQTRGETFTDVANGDFETAGGGGADVFSGWSEAAGGGAITDETTQVGKGSHAAKLTNGAIIYQSVTVRPKYEYKFSVYTRTKDKISLANGNMEDGSGTTFTGWTNVSGSGSVGSEATIVSKGARAVKLINDAYIHQSVTVSPKNEYELSVYTCGDGTNDGGIGIYDVTNSAYIINNKPTGVTETKYRRVEHKFTAPPSCTSIRIELHGTGAALSPAYFDVAKLEQITNEQCGKVVIYDATGSVYIVNAEPTGVTSDRYTRYERSFVTPPSCTSITISLLAPQEGEVYFDQAELEYVQGANSLRMRVYDNTNTAFIVPVFKTLHSGDKYARYDLDFVTPNGCTSIDVRLQGGVDSVIWVDEASLFIFENDEVGHGYTDWVTDSTSISRYGRKEFIVDATAHPMDTANIMATAILNKCSWPMIKESGFDVGQIQAPTLQVYCLGLIPQSNNRYATEQTPGLTNDVLTALIEATDYLSAQNVDLKSSTDANLRKDTPARSLTEIMRALTVAHNGDDFAAMWCDKFGRVTATSDPAYVPTYYLRNGIIAENFSGSQPASPRQVRPGIVIDAEWLFRADKKNYLLDKSGAFLMTSVKVSADGKVTPQLVTTDELDIVLSAYK